MSVVVAAVKDKQNICHSPEMFNSIYFTSIHILFFGKQWRNQASQSTDNGNVSQTT